MTIPAHKTYKAWDLPVRVFHWINFMCVLILSFLGLIMLHIVFVIRAENTGEGTLISALFSGKKHLPREPVDK